MLKEVIIVGGAAAIGEYGVRKWGTALEVKFVEMKIPPTIGHALVVGGFTGAAFLILRTVL